MNASYRPELQALYALKRSSMHRQSICRGYAQYEARKQDWIRSNPEAAPEQYDIAMRRIANLCGV